MRISARIEITPRIDGTVIMDCVWLETDNVIRVRGLKDEVSGSYINDAVITATLYDSSDVEVPGAANISIPYVAGTDGDYAGEIPSTVSLTEGASYTTKVTITGNGYKTTYTIVRRAKYKGP